MASPNMLVPHTTTNRHIRYVGRHDDRGATPVHSRRPRHAAGPHRTRAGAGAAARLSAAHASSARPAVAALVTGYYEDR